MRALPADPGHLIVSCDGASRGNPGPAGIGAQITGEDGTVLGEIAEGIGETTNNVAEYTAAIEGLSLAKELGATTVTLRSEHLQPLYRRARGLAAGFERISFEHVPREQNTAADALANLGVDRWLAGER